MVRFSGALHTVFLVGACVAAMAYVLSLFLEERSLRTVSGLQARASAEAVSADGDIAPGLTT